MSSTSIAHALRIQRSDQAGKEQQIMTLGITALMASRRNFDFKSNSLGESIPGARLAQMLQRSLTVGATDRAKVLALSGITL